MSGSHHEPVLLINLCISNSQFSLKKGVFNALDARYRLTC